MLRWWIYNWDVCKSTKHRSMQDVQLLQCSKKWQKWKCAGTLVVSQTPFTDKTGSVRQAATTHWQYENPQLLEECWVLRVVLKMILWMYEQIDTTYTQFRLHIIYKRSWCTDYTAYLSVECEVWFTWISTNCCILCFELKNDLQIIYLVFFGKNLAEEC